MKKKALMVLLMVLGITISYCGRDVLADITYEEEISSESIPYEKTDLLLPTAFDGRSKGLVTSIKDQGDTPYCLTYARIAALESALIKKGFETNSVDLSEMHMLYEKWAGSNSDSSFSDWCPYSGHEYVGGQGGFEYTFISRNFPVYESKMPMAKVTDGYMPDTSQIASSPYEIRTIYSDYKGSDADIIQKTKEAIYRYGGVAASLLYVPPVNDTSYKFFGKGDYSYYLSEEKDGFEHAIEIVGWDDAYSKNSFSSMPPGNGAFLCKNSWGYVNGSSGYFWLSYYSKSGLTWETFDVAKKGTTARSIKALPETLNIYVGQTSDPLSVELSPKSADPIEWYIDIAEDDEYLRVNPDNSITCKKYQTPGPGDDQTRSMRFVYLKSKDKDLGLSTRLTINMIPNKLKAEGEMLIPDNGLGDPRRGVSVSPMSERKQDIVYKGQGGVVLNEEKAVPLAYGNGSVKATLDGQSVNIPCYVYCTGFELGPDMENNGSVNAILSPTFMLDEKTDRLKELITYTSSDENVAKVDGQFIYFTGNGKAVIRGKLLDEKLTNGVELTDSFMVTVSGLESGMEDTGYSYDSSYDQAPGDSKAQQTEPVIDTATVDLAPEFGKVEIPKTDQSYPQNAGVKEKAPGKVKILSKKVSSKGKVSLKWKKVSGAKRYEIQISPSKSFSKAKSYYARKEKKTINGLSSGGKYYIRIRAIGKTRYGKWSKKEQITKK